MEKTGMILDIVKKYELYLLVYFGSYMTEFYHAESDIDIAFLAKKPLSSKEKVSLFEDLIIYHRKSEIDLVDLQTADPILRYEIGSKGRLIYEAEEGLFERYSLYYLKRIYELKPIIQEEMNALKQAVRDVIDNAW